MQTFPKIRRFETLSYLPPLSDDQIMRQVQYILDRGYIPGVEFSDESEPTQHFWTLWKLPLFNVTTTSEVLSEVRSCRSEYNNCFIRVVGFDNIKQCQVLSFIVHKPNQR
jgi:ribulose-bisphosphate carboxylase small chain